MTVLEAGCGVGDDARRMAERVVPDGRVVAFDSSMAMIRKARSALRHACLPIEFRVGDVRELPFPDNVFSRCRTDRVLQHVLEPERAVSELVRVLEPGGMLLAYDNDWNTFSVSSGDCELTRSFEKFWCESFANPGIGSDLCHLLISSGLSNVTKYSGIFQITEFAAADKVYNLRETVRRAAEKGLIGKPEGCRWIEELIDRSRKGTFLATLTAYTVVGEKIG